jgi:hypothetical protein
MIQPPQIRLQNFTGHKSTVMFQPPQIRPQIFTGHKSTVMLQPPQIRPQTFTGHKSTVMLQPPQIRLQMVTGHKSTVMLQPPQIRPQTVTMTPPNFEIFKIWKKGTFTANDYELAKRILIQQAQKQFPPSEREAENLGLFFDMKSVMCRGRLQNSSLNISSIFPIFLPKCQLAKTKILYYHKKVYHSGIQSTLAAIRESILLFCKILNCYLSNFIIAC